MTSILYTLLGGSLVVVGVMAAAIADRVRGIRIAREHPVAASTTAVTPRTRDAEVIQRSRQLFGSGSPEEQEVVSALVASGYKKGVATDAARGCAAADRATIEGWTAAALRRAGKGAPS